MAKKGGAPTTVFSAAATATTNKPGAFGAMEPWSDAPGSTATGDMTVEAFLGKQCDVILDDVRKHAAGLIAKLQQEYAEGAQEVQVLMKSAAPAGASSSSSRLCITLKCLTGPHMGQKFRLEPPPGKVEDSFKVGRSTGKAFKEKGLSLYKDKEVSTAHGKFEIRNGSGYYVDTKSTNGTQLNGSTITTQEPALLKTGDLLNIGGTEVAVIVTVTDESSEGGGEGEGEDAENFASV